MSPRKTLQKILSGSRNVRFQDMAGLIEAFGFRHVRASGSHFIFNHPGVRELINIQNVGGQAKPYQVRQFMKLVEKYNLQLTNE
jgi:predicted RNA binding protein YcfA (HicA-like mRNA interferase family)